MSQVIVNSLLIKGMLLGLRKNNGCKLFYFLNKIRSHQITTVSMAPFDPKSTSKWRSALHFRYTIVIEAGLRIFSIFISAQHSQNCSFCIFTEDTFSVPWIALDNLTQFVNMSYDMLNTHCAEYP